MGNRRYFDVLKEGAYIALGFVGGVDTVLDVYELGRSLMNHDWTGAAFAAVVLVIPCVWAPTGKALAKGLESRAVRELGEEALEEGVERAVSKTGGALVKAGSNFGTHTLERMVQRGITPKMVERALAKGTKFWDPKNKVINYVLRGGFGSGKDLLVGQNPVTGKITTAIRGRNLVRPRFVPLD